MTLRGGHPNCSRIKYLCNKTQINSISWQGEQLQPHLINEGFKRAVVIFSEALFRQNYAKL